MATSKVNFTFYCRPVISQFGCFPSVQPWLPSYAVVLTVAMSRAQNGCWCPCLIPALPASSVQPPGQTDLSIVGNFALQGSTPWSVLVSDCITCLAKYLAYYRIAAAPHSHPHRPSAFQSSRARLGSSSALGSAHCLFRRPCVRSMPCTLQLG